LNISRSGRFAALCVMLITPFLTTGCYDRQELEQQAFVTILGVDAAPGGLIDCTFRIALPTNPSSSGSSGKTPLAGAVPVTFRAHSITEAMLLANSSVERTITLSHLTDIIFGKQVAEKGILPYIRPMVRFREFRRTTLFSVSNTTAREVISEQKPMLESSTGRIADSIAMVGTRTGLYPTAHIHDLMSAIENPHEDIIAPVFAVNPAVLSDPKAKEGIAEPGVNYRAGQIRTVGGNPVETIGAAVFHGDKMIDYLDGEDCIFVNILRGGVRTTRFDFTDPEKKTQNISAVMRREHEPDYAISLLPNATKVEINTPIDVDITNVGSGTDYTDPAMHRRLEESLSQQLSDRLTKIIHKLEVEDGTDCIPISKYIRKNFRTHQEFENFPWEKRLKTADISIHVAARVRRFGIQMEPLKAD
jgi:spore germination protein KC